MAAGKHPRSAEELRKGDKVVTRAGTQIVVDHVVLATERSSHCVVVGTSAAGLPYRATVHRAERLESWQAR